MISEYCLIILAALLAVSATWKLLKLRPKGCSSHKSTLTQGDIIDNNSPQPQGSLLHDFDVSNTLPLRGVLAVIIVCHHLGLIYPNDPIGAFTKFGAPTVAVFFFISGYGLTVSLIKRGEKYLDGFLWHRLSKILPVFLTLTIAYALYLCFGRGMSVGKIVHDCTKGSFPLPDSWFIYAIIYLYVVFYAACRASRSWKWRIILTTGLTLMAMGLIVLAGWGRHWWLSLPAFVEGMIVAAYEKRFRDLLCRNTGAILLPTAAVMIGAFTAYMNGKYHIRVANFIYSNQLPILVIAAVYAFGSIRNNALNYLGKISLEIYLVQGIVHVSLSSLWLPWYFLVVLTFLITIPCAHVCHMAAERINIPLRTKRQA